MAKYRTISHYLDEPLLAELDRQIQFGRQQERHRISERYVREKLYVEMPMHAMYESACSQGKPNLKVVPRHESHGRAANMGH